MSLDKEIADTVARAWAPRLTCELLEPSPFKLPPSPPLPWYRRKLFAYRYFRWRLRCAYDVLRGKASAYYD